MGLFNRMLDVVLYHGTYIKPDRV